MASAASEMPKEMLKLGSVEPKNGAVEFSGLDFLLQACDVLEPTAYTTYKIDGQGLRSPSVAAAKVRSTRGRRPRDDVYDFSPNQSDEDNDEHCKVRPSKRTKIQRRERRNATIYLNDGAVIPAPTADGGMGPIRWERGLVTGPCTNPECDNPYHSPQWRKGPAEYPILCNACGTRWLRNGTVRPLVVRAYKQLTVC